MMFHGEMNYLHQNQKSIMEFNAEPGWGCNLNETALKKYQWKG